MELNKRYKRTLTLIGVTVLTVFTLIIAGFYIISYLILPPQRLTPLVIGAVNENLNARLDAERIELTLWSTLPYIGLKIENGSLVSTTSRESWNRDTTLCLVTDTLVQFRSITASLLPLEFLFRNELSIPSIRIDSLSVYAHVNSRGKANWDIVKPDTTQNKPDQPMINLDLRKLNANYTHLWYDNDQDTVHLQVIDAGISLSASQADSVSTLVTDFSMAGLVITTPTLQFNSHQRIGLKADLQAERNFSVFKIRNAGLLINGLDLDLTGMAQQRSENKNRYDLEMEMTLRSSSLSDFVKIIPTGLIDLSEYKADGEASVAGKVYGTVGEGMLPSLDLACKVSNGKLETNKYNNIDSLELDFEMKLDMTKQKPSYIHMNRAYAKVGNSFLEIKANIDNLMANQAINGSFKSHLDFGTLAATLLPSDSITMSGVISTDLSVKLTSNDLLRSNYGNMKAEGHIGIDSLKIESIKDTLELFIERAEALLVKPVATKSKDAMGLNGSLTIDSLSLRYKNDELRALIKGGAFQFNTTPFSSRKDTDDIIPLSAKLQIAGLLVSSADSMTYAVKSVASSMAFKPSAKNPKIPVLELKMKTDTTLARFGSFGFFIDNLRGKMDATHYEPDSIALRRLETARIARIARGDTTAIKSRLNNETGNNLFRKWDLSGVLNMTKLRARSKYFSLPISMAEAKINYTTNEVHLHDTRLQVGRSSMELTGDISSLRRTILRSGKLMARMAVKADSIHLNELIPALNGWVALSSEQKQEPNAFPQAKLSAEELSDAIDSLMTDPVTTVPQSTDSTVFAVPDFIDFELASKIKWLGYGNGVMTNVNGDIKIKNGYIEVSNLGMSSEYGQGKLTLIYSPTSTKSAFTGFDLELKAVEVNKLLDLYPPIDTLIPMLRSFEGVVDCQMAATANLDSAMNIMLPSLNAACYMHGINMVLLDGQTFAEISKKLMFKNKKRNQIDSISVEMLVRNNRIEIFPFVLEMDRYKAAVAGVQNLDMSFSYHISVLKSPLPFKIGVDVNGTLDKFKYKLTKAKLKEANIASRKSIIDSTQVNLRQGIREQLDKMGSGRRPVINLLPTSLDTLAHSLITVLDSVAPLQRSEEDSLMKAIEAPLDTIGENEPKTTP